MRKRGEYRVILLTALFMVTFLYIALSYFSLSRDRAHVRTAEENSLVTIHAGDSRGTVYDRNFTPFTNASTEIVGIAVPSAVPLSQLTEIAADPAEAEKKYAAGVPFALVCTKKTAESEGLTFFDIPVRYGETFPAVHTVGCLSEDRGASGLEYSYDTMLRTGNIENSVTYSTDGFGNVLIGSGKSVIRSTKAKTGIVTTLDMGIQRICEEGGAALEKGAVVVTDVKNGEILGLASFPAYDPMNISAALNDSRSPLINRALYSYSVGSIFKLVTAGEALREDLGGFVSDCTGSVDVSGQLFRCHDLAGHGVEDMTAAAVNSCNPYFISLSRLLDIPKLRSFAYSMGFGREIHLSAGMIGDPGVLPSVDDLLIPAELANFSFGQGKLSASPLQINRMTCAIANGGELMELRLIRGITLDGETVGDEKRTLRSQVMEPGIAEKLREMMTAALNENESSKGIPRYVKAAAKTSTAQTGRFDDKGEELCNGWITGFFPAGKPRYAVTVLAEDGGYGNESAAPVFREIADKIIRMQRK